MRINERIYRRELFVEPSTLKIGLARVREVTASREGSCWRYYGSMSTIRITGNGTVWAHLGFDAKG